MPKKPQRYGKGITSAMVKKKKKAAKIVKRTRMGKSLMSNRK